MEGLQKRFQAEVEKYKAVQKDYQKCVSTRQQLESQLSENNGVKEELDKLEEGANVYKLIGPALVKQDIEEAKQTVQKRIDYINSELKRNESLMTEQTKKQEAIGETLNKLKAQLQQAQVKAAAK